MRLRNSVLGALAALMFASIANAQTINPTKIIFTASSDHNAVVAGVSVVDHYDFTVVTTSGTVTTVFTRSLGKPTPATPVPPATTGDITVDLSTDFNGISVNGLYNGAVAAVGPGGQASTPQVPFGHVGQPVAASNLRYSVQ